MRAVCALMTSSNLVLALHRVRSRLVGFERQHGRRDLDRYKVHGWPFVSREFAAETGSAVDCIVSQPVWSLWAMSDLQKYTRHSGELARPHAVSEA
jgi:hypothetical protein